MIWRGLRHNKRYHRLRHICTDRALIIRALSLLGFGKNLRAHTSAHTLDELFLFDQRLVFRIDILPAPTALKNGLEAARGQPMVTNNLQAGNQSFLEAIIATPTPS